MNEQEITAAALRWHAANIKRLEDGAEKRKEQQRTKERTGYAIVSSATDQRASEARRIERTARRALAKACAKSLEVYTVDVDATESTATLFLLTGELSSPVIQQTRSTDGNH